MRYIETESLEPGQYLGRTIFSANGTVLLSGGVQLTVAMINTLKRIGVTMVYIKDLQFDDVEIADVLSEETKRAVMSKMVETFDTVRSGKEFSTKQISITVDQLLEDIMRNKEVLVQLSDIRTADNEYYVHAMNVSMMSVLIGINMNLNASQLKDLAIGALLHDIGKAGDYEDEAEDTRRHHAWRGFEVLKNKREFNLLIAHIALQHHERLDGSGKPRKLAEEQIHLYAKIVTVANTFDNLLFDRQTGNRMLPHEACEYMMTLAGKQLDREALLNFLRTVSVYPTGCSVRLSTKETGVVVGQHRGLPSRPIVRVVRRDGEDGYEVKEVDLARQTTVFIDAVLA